MTDTDRGAFPPAPSVGDKDNAMEILQTLNHAVAVVEMPARSSCHMLSREATAIMCVLDKSPGVAATTRGATQEDSTPMPDQPTRKYALTRITRGDYLLPSNDTRWLWRIYTYEEDGSLFRGERQVKGVFWACARRPMPLKSAILDEDFLGWSDWEFWAGPLSSRTAAIEEALRAPD